MRFFRVIVAVAGLFALGVVPATTAGAATNPWKLQPVAIPSGATQTVLTGVSCRSKDRCEAVGLYVNSAGVQVTLAEAWNGATWTVQPTPNPTGSEQASLAGVSCATANTCQAVGDFRNSTGRVRALAEGWNGTRWTIHPTPNPLPSPFVSLTGVSCLAGSGCEAVGTYLTPKGGLMLTVAEGWNGKRWTLQPSVNQAGAGMITELNGISCTAGPICEAVGETFNNNVDGPTDVFVEVWNGTTWTQQQFSQPIGGGALDGVSCTAATLCEAVGSHFTGTFSSGTSTGHTLAEVWNGTDWSIQRTANRPSTGLSLDNLNGVSCVRRGSCDAVGFYASNTFDGNDVDLTETFDGTAWTLEGAPKPGSFNTFNGVSCSTAHVCEAVGVSTDSAGNAVPLAVAGG